MRRFRTLGTAVLIGISIVAAVALGYFLAKNATQSVTQRTAVGYDYGGVAGGIGSADAAKSTAPEAAGAPAQPSAPNGTAAGGSQDLRKIVRTAALQIRVDHVQAALTRIRAIVAAAGGEVSDLTVSGGDQPTPVPLAEGAVSSPVPVNANMTLRVPVAKLAVVRQRVSRLGRVISESASENDVTQQHIDLTARLKNLRAEEVRLRSFLTKTNKVSELLQVESELARVRGEIESLQGQLDYLNRQVDMATLVVALEEPGPVVQPGSGGWGVGDAVRAGIAGAVTVIRTAITAAIAIAPLLLLALAIWGLVALVRRARSRRLGNGVAGESDDAVETTAQDVGSPSDEEGVR